MTPEYQHSQLSVKQSEIAKAAVLLQELIKSAPMKQLDIERVLGSKGFTLQIIHYASVSLNVTKRRVGDIWYWSFSIYADPF